MLAHRMLGLGGGKKLKVGLHDGGIIGFKNDSLTQTFNLPSFRNEDYEYFTPEEGDLLICFVSLFLKHLDSNNMITADGYTLLHSTTAGHYTEGISFFVGYKIVGSTPDTQIATTSSAASDSPAALSMVLVKGANPSTPFLTTAFAEGFDTSTISCPAVSFQDTAPVLLLGGLASVFYEYPTEPVGVDFFQWGRKTLTPEVYYECAANGLAIINETGSLTPPVFLPSSEDVRASWAGATLVLNME